MLDALGAEGARWRADPVLWVREALGVTPTPQQEAILRAIQPRGAHVSVASGHNTGKSTVLAWEVLRTLALYPDCQVPCTAPTAHQLQDVLWSALAKWRQKLAPWLREQLVVQASRVTVAGAGETRFAVARTARADNPDALQGFHADNLLFVVDEASGVPDVIFQVAEGALSSPGARVILTGNPTRADGYFWRSHHRDRDKWVRLEMSSLESPLCDPDYAKDMGEKYGVDSDIYRVRVLGQFPSASVVQLIPRDLAEAAQGRHLRPDQYSTAGTILGVDVAWHGDDRSCVYLRQGLRATWLGTWHDVDNMQLAGLVAQFEDQHRADAVCIDVGWGAGVIDRLRQMGRRPIPVNFGSKPLDEARYANKRAEMWCLMKDWLASGSKAPGEAGAAIPDRQDLIDDLCGPQYFFTPSGKIALESKDDMRKRGLASPDEGDALALTFAVNVRARDLAGQPLQRPVVINKWKLL